MIFIGSFFQLVLMIAVVVGSTGATSWKPLTRWARPIPGWCGAC